MMKLERLSGLELGSLIRAKQISAVESINYFLDRIELKDPEINAFTYIAADYALEAARSIDAKISNNEQVGLFAGVPIGLKDFLPSKRGWLNSHGGVPSLVRMDDGDSAFYTAASKLGAITLGKTNAPAFGFSGACQNVMFGSTKNPFDTTRTSGGSSGGSAAAVASGMLLLSEGGDAGGSIRIPAGWCNLFGYKPSLGTVPSYCRPDGWSATHPYCFNGALTKSVEDSAALLTEMATYNPRDPISLPINANKNFLSLLDKPLRHKKIALTIDFGMYRVDPKVAEMVESTANMFRYAGVDVDLVDIRFEHSLEEIMTCWAWSISVDTAIDLAIWKREGLDLVKEHPEELPKEFIYFNEVAKNATIFDMRSFNEIRTDILDTFEDVFEKYDFIVSPTAACLPLPLEWDGHAKEIAGYPVDPDTDFISFGETPVVNFVGYPAASVPAGLVDDKYPVGMQLIGKQYHDDDVLALAYTLEQLKPWAMNYSKSM